MYFPKKYFSTRNSVINTLFLTENTIPMDPVKIGMQLDEQERDLPRILEEFRRNEYEGSTAENTEDGPGYATH